ncbi:MAG: metal-sensitive transcriptional regulator [Armatimonadota bacterium]
MRKDRPAHGDVLTRLARIEGHTRGIRRMIEDERPCEDVLLQIGAVQAAWRKVSEIILEDHLEHCIAEAVEEGRSDAALRDLKMALSRAHLIGGS